VRELKKTYSDDFKEQLIKECHEVGNVAVVARRHEIPGNTLHSWIKAARVKGSTKVLPRKSNDRVAELETRLETVSTQNEQLKRLVAEKELELAILRDLRDKLNPR
jgi:transposase-like protein